MSYWKWPPHDCSLAHRRLMWPPAQHICGEQCHTHTHFLMFAETDTRLDIVHNHRYDLYHRHPHRHSRKKKQLQIPVCSRCNQSPDAKGILTILQYTTQERIAAQHTVQCFAKWETSSGANGWCLHMLCHCNKKKNQSHKSIIVDKRALLWKWSTITNRENECSERWERLN